MKVFPLVNTNVVMVWWGWWEDGSLSTCQTVTARLPVVVVVVVGAVVVVVVVVGAVVVVVVVGAVVVVEVVDAATVVLVVVVVVGAVVVVVVVVGAVKTVLGVQPDAPWLLRARTRTKTCSLLLAGSKSKLASDIERRSPTEDIQL